MCPVKLGPASVHWYGNQSKLVQDVAPVRVLQDSFQPASVVATFVTSLVIIVSRWTTLYYLLTFCKFSILSFDSWAIMVENASYALLYRGWDFTPYQCHNTNVKQKYLEFVLPVQNWTWKLIYELQVIVCNIKWVPGRVSHTQGEKAARRIGFRVGFL